MNAVGKIVGTLAVALFTFVGHAETKPPAPEGRAIKKAAVRVVEIAVTEQGFEPTTVKLKKGEPVKLVLTRKTDQTCAKAVIFPDLKIQKDLPLGQPVEVTFTPKKAGALSYGCTMGQMVAATLQVEP